MIVIGKTFGGGFTKHLNTFRSIKASRLYDASIERNILRIFIQFFFLIYQVHPPQSVKNKNITNLVISAV